MNYWILPGPEGEFVALNEILRVHPHVQISRCNGYAFRVSTDLQQSELTELVKRMSPEAEILASCELSVATDQKTRDRSGLSEDTQSAIDLIDDAEKTHPAWPAFVRKARIKLNDSPTAAWEWFRAGWSNNG